MYGLIDLASLRAFVEVVRQQNVTRAASRLNTAQPAVTRRLHLLEEAMGVPLLMRHRRGVRPTEAGMILFERAELLLRLAGELQSEVLAETREPRGHLRFGYPPSVGNVMVAGLVSDFLRRFPQVSLALHEQFSPAVRDALVAGRLDVGIMSCDANHPDLTFVPLFQERLWLIGPPAKWSFGKGSSLPLRRLAGVPLLLAGFLRQALDRIGLEKDLQFNVRLEADALTTLCEAVRMRAGYLVGPPSSVRHELERREFVGAPIQGLRVSRGLFRRNDRPVTRALQELIQLVEGEAIRLLKRYPKIYQPVEGT
jgi:LysR family transcriptional regulator, nitrogen assimilation regulatory protein